MNSITDFKLALRALAKCPAAMAVSVLALALGIGVNISCFTMVNAIVLHPLAYPHPEEIQTLWESVPKANSEDDRDLVAAANFLDWQSRSHAFKHVAAYRPWDAGLTGTGEPEHVQGCLVSSEFFPLLGLRPSMGRLFTADETNPGRDSEVIVSEGFWRSRLAAAPDAVGQSITLDGRTYRVIAVMPSEVDYPLATDVWAPLALTAEERNRRGTRDTMVLARLKPGVSRKQAQAEMNSIAQRLAAEYPNTNENRGAIVIPLRQLTNNVTDRFAVTLLGCAAFVLLLACANVGNLQLSRAIARQKMFAVQATLGAGRFRIARQLMVEAIVISLLGGALGLWVANWRLEMNRDSIPAEVYRWVAGFKDLRVTAGVVWFTLAASLAGGLLCGLPAAYQLLRRKASVRLVDALKEGGRGSAVGSTRSRLRNGLMICEVAIALVLLVGAGLMVRTFRNLLIMGPGYETKHLLTMQIDLPAANYREPARVTEFYDNAVRELAALPDVRVAGAMAYTASAERFLIEGRPEPRPDEMIPGIRSVSDEYVQALGLPSVSGRFLSARDRAESTRVVLLSESVVQHYWPRFRHGGEEPVGHRVRLGGKNSPWLTVVGVVGDIKDWFRQRPTPLAYVPYAQQPELSMQLVIRTRTDPLRSVAAARAALRNVDPNRPLYEVKTMEQWVSKATSGVRASATSMTNYAVIALLLAVTGIYAVVAYAVVQRTHEIGVRMALGADRAEILRMTLAYALRMAGIGLAIGIPAAFLLMRFVSHLLYDVVVVDPFTVAGFVAILGASALAAGYIPARQATRVDPLVALRAD